MVWLVQYMRSRQTAVGGPELSLAPMYANLLREGIRRVLEARGSENADVHLRCLLSRCVGAVARVHGTRVAEYGCTTKIQLILARGAE